MYKPQHGWHHHKIRWAWSDLYNKHKQHFEMIFRGSPVEPSCQVVCRASIQVNVKLISCNPFLMMMAVNSRPLDALFKSGSGSELWMRFSKWKHDIWNYRMTSKFVCKRSPNYCKQSFCSIAYLQFVMWLHSGVAMSIDCNALPKGVYKTTASFTAICMRCQVWSLSLLSTKTSTPQMSTCHLSHSDEYFHFAYPVSPICTLLLLNTQLHQLKLSYFIHSLKNKSTHFLGKGLAKHTSLQSSINFSLCHMASFCWRIDETLSQDRLSFWSSICRNLWKTTPF